MGFFDFLRKIPEEKSNYEEFSPRARKARLTESVHQTSDMDALLRESSFPFSNPDVGTDFDDRFFVAVDRAAPLDLAQRRLHTLQRLCLLSYRRNPRAFRAIELPKNFGLGEGIRFHAADQKVQDTLKTHWEINQWDETAELLWRSLAIFGELLLPAFTREGDGIVTLGEIPALFLRAIRVDKENTAELTTAVTSIGSSPESTMDGKKFSIIRPDREGGLVDGKDPAFFFAVNRIGGSRRGLPDLSPSLDWLEGLDGFTMTMLERAVLASEVVHDLKYTGLKDSEIKDKVDQFNSAMSAGGTYGHSEGVELTILTPEMGASEADTITKILNKTILAGVGLSGLHWGDSEDLTRASAAELSIPVTKNIKSRQLFFKRMIDLIFKYQIQKSVEAGPLRGVKDLSFQVDMPNIFLRDMTSATESLSKLSEALGIAVDRTWISNEQAGASFRIGLDQIGSVVETENINRDALPDSSQAGGNNNGVEKDTEKEEEAAAPDRAVAESLGR